MLEKLFILNNKYILANNFKTANKIFCAYIFKCNNNKSFERSVVYWVLQIFRNSPKYETCLMINETRNKNNTEIKQLLKNKYSLSLLNTDELLNYLLIISKYNVIKDKDVIKNVDDEFIRRLQMYDYVNDNDKYKDVLKVTDSLIYFTHNKIRLRSYLACVENIKSIIKNKEITLQHFIQCAFYVSILKGDPIAREIMNLVIVKLYTQTKIFNGLTSTELAIFCNSVYKTGTKIKSKKVLRAIIDAIDKDTDMLFTNDKLCTSILKPLHQAKYHDYSFLKNLSSKIINKHEADIEKYNFTTNVYLLKLFSNALYNDEFLINYLADSAIRKLQTMYKNKEYIRAKDISILLKSFCELGYDSLKQRTVKDVLPVIKDAINNDHIEQIEQPSLAEIILWLNVLFPCENDFMDKVINSRIIVKGKNNTIKGTARMNLLLIILYIEKLLPATKIDELISLIEPTRGRDLSMERIFELHYPIYRTYQAVKCLAMTNNSMIKNVTLECQIPNLFIPGITVDGER
ncbi:uncharacterized protein LOC142321514 isoform X2 [Lycorma delicatula]